MVRQAHHERIKKYPTCRVRVFSLASLRANTPLILSLSKDKLVVRQAHHERIKKYPTCRVRVFSLASLRANTPLILSLSKDKLVVRQAHHERIKKYPTCRVRVFSLASLRANTPLILSLSKDKLVVRQARHERQGNRVLTRATQTTVVPAKAGIQEILQEKRMPATEDSGFRLSPERRVYDNDGFMTGMTGLFCDCPALSG